MYNKQLDAFIKAAELGSFSKAAAALFITPSSLIQQINLLENHLGVHLFNRSARGVKLTTAGASVFEDAKNIVHLSHVAVERARTIDQKKDSVVKVGTTLLTRCRYLTDIWSRAAAEHPEIKIELVAPQKSIESLTANPLSEIGVNYDLVEGIYLSGLYNGKCNFLEIFPAKICISVPVGHPLFSKDILSLSDLQGEKIILGKRGHSNSFDEARNILEQADCNLEIMDVDFYDINIFSTCELNNCLMITLNVWADIYPSLKTCLVEWDATIPYGFAYPFNPTKEVQILIETAKSLVEEGYFNSYTVGKQKFPIT